MRIVAMAATLVALAVPVVGAQDRGAGAADTPIVRVRLRDDSTVRGFLRGNSADEVVVFTGEGRYRHVPLSDVQRFEVRRRTGTHVKRGAVMGVFLWASLMFAASIDSLEDAGPASWQSAAILAGGAGLGAVAGRSVPRYGWVPTEPSRLTGPAPAVRVTIRF
jgi:hypothetical protein